MENCIIFNPFLAKLFEYKKNKDYVNITKYIQIIELKKYLKRKIVYNDFLDSYINSHNKKYLNNIVNIFYKSIIIYNFICKHKKNMKKNMTKNMKKEIINEENLYGQPIIDCKEKIIYIKCREKNCSHKYYAFPYSELNKIFTNSLLFMDYNSAIINSKYPQNPWTNKQFNINQLEYIVYQFRFHSLHHHKIIDMFAYSNFSLSKLIEIYDGYLYSLSSQLFIKQLSKIKFKKIFLKLWLFVSSTYSFDKRIKDKYPRLPNIICKKSILSIDNFQKEFTPLVMDYYSNFYKRIIIYKEDILNALKFKYRFVSFLEDKYPHTFKNKDYYHFYYNKYIKKKKLNNLILIILNYLL